ncbi:MAG TPA: hypothetical protein VHE60_09475 [Pyrinomonadaceae bacterium]|nr:hypothetical protein [Pyrinomonadaceae bacterium]
MQIQDATGALSKLFGKIKPQETEIESVHQATLDIAQLPKVIADPKAVVKALGVAVSGESQIQVTVKQRAQRKAAARRRIIIIIIHYSNCDADIIIFA